MKNIFVNTQSRSATFNRSTAAQYTMKKFLLILSIFVVSLSAIAADLNPFAYGLRSSVNATNPMRLDIEYKLNAPATSVKVYLYDVDKTWEQEVTVQELLPKKLDDHRTAYSYTGWIDLSVIPGHLRGGENNILWRVDVTGKAVDAMTFVDYSVKMYAPTSVDIDNNPENANFGTVFCIEGRDYPYNKEAYKDYISYTDGAGLYVLNADGTRRKMEFWDGDARYGYNGGMLPAHGAAVKYFDETNSKCQEYASYRVRVADDGRIFISSMSVPRNVTINGQTVSNVSQVLWEANKMCFSATNKDEWKTGWTRVITSLNENTIVDLAGTGAYLNNKYNSYTKEGDFVAGPNIGFDVRGGGGDLQLLMLSGCVRAIVSNTQQYFRCYEYDLGSATVFDRKADKLMFEGHTPFSYTDPQVEYDKEGNAWLSVYRSGDVATLIRYNKSGNGVVDYSEKIPYLRKGALRFNKDFTQFALATRGGTTGNGGAVTIYPVKSDGMPDFTSGKEVSVKDKTSYELMDFAWDYANNLYIAAKNKDDSAGECIAVYATPRKADDVVSTPAATGYAFSISCTAGEYYNVEVVSSNSNYGTVEGGGTVASCEDVEVFAQSKEGYKFVCWKEGDNVVSSQNPYKFPVTKNITLTAYFEAGDYAVTWWNLFKGGEDITALSTDNSYNARFWRLYQVELNAFDVVKSDYKHTPSGKSRRFNVGGFLDTRFSHSMQLIEGDPHSDSNKENKGMFTWLRDYLTYMNGGEEIVQKYFGDKDGNNSIPESYRWGYYLYLFVNRTDTAYDSGGTNNVNCLVIGEDWGSKHEYWKKKDGVYDKSKSFRDYGKPEYWRPWWTKGACDLPMTINSQGGLPIDWKKISLSGGTIKDADNSSIVYDPSSWYQWNTAPKSDQLLAWRDGGTTGRIVHHVYRDNMKLYATYVDAHLQENDPQPDLSKNPYDATNNDVLDLLANDNHGSTPHNVTVDRKFAGGMYNTVCFPFDLPITSLPVELRDADILAFTGVTKTGDEFGDPVAILNFIPLADYWQLRNNPPDVPYMEAGVPYLIKPKNDVNNASLTYTNLLQWRFFNSSSTPNQERVGGVTFQGVLNPTTITEENAYILVADNRLAKVTGNNREIKGYRGYFIINDAALRNMAAEGRVYFSFKKPVTTSIPIAPEAEQAVQPKVRKVMYDGQIYILRGEEVYTITGHRVK